MRRSKKVKKRKVESDLNSLSYMFSWATINYNQLPLYMKDNDYIRTNSVFRLHNEMANIWLHIIGSLIYLWIFLKLSFSKPENYTLVDYLMLSSYCVINMICFSFSSLFHILNCLDQETYLFWCKLDYFGITLLISSSIITWCYYAFHL